RPHRPCRHRHPCRLAPSSPLHVVGWARSPPLLPPLEPLTRRADRRFRSARAAARRLSARIGKIAADRRVQWLVGLAAVVIALWLVRDQLQQISGAALIAV